MMKMIITKEMIEKAIGGEFSYLKLEPIIGEDGECTGLNVFIYPIASVKHINMSITINPIANQMV